MVIYGISMEIYHLLTWNIIYGHLSIIDQWYIINMEILT